MFPYDLPPWLWDRIPLKEDPQQAANGEGWKSAPTEAAATWALESTLYGLVSNSGNRA
jgi:hypothetical protein